MNDLSYVPSEDMLRELRRRFDEMIFLGSTKRTKQVEDLTVLFSGSYHACIGLVEVGRMAIQAGGAFDDEDSAD